MILFLCIVATVIALAMIVLLATGAGTDMRFTDTDEFFDEVRKGREEE